MLGLPYALVMAHVSAEVVLRMFSTSAQRAEGIVLKSTDFGETVTGFLTTAQKRSMAVLGAAVALWFSEPLHGIDPALVAVLAALLMCSPQVGCVDFKDTIRQVPWNLLLFMAATIAMSQALLSSGAAAVLRGRRGLSISLLGSNTSNAVHRTGHHCVLRSAPGDPVAFGALGSINPLGRGHCTRDWRQSRRRRVHLHGGCRFLPHVAILGQAAGYLRQC